MTIHMKSLGITVEEIGIIYGIVPFFGVLAPSIMGMIADKLGNFKVSPCYILSIGRHSVRSTFTASTSPNFLCKSTFAVLVLRVPYLHIFNLKLFVKSVCT